MILARTTSTITNLLPKSSCIVLYQRDLLLFSKDLPDIAKLYPVTLPELLLNHACPVVIMIMFLFPFLSQIQSPRQTLNVKI